MHILKIINSNLWMKEGSSIISNTQHELFVPLYLETCPKVLDFKLKDKDFYLLNNVTCNMYLFQKKKENGVKQKEGQKHLLLTPTEIIALIMKYILRNI